MAAKPTYLGLLNAIAVAEARNYVNLMAWADVTKDQEVRSALRTVALREGEHGMSFARRINELGFEVRDKGSEEVAKGLAIASSDRSDLEKMEKLGFANLDTGDQPDVFDGVFKDHSIDIQTGELLGRYVAEERDTARLLKGCYEQLRSRQGRAEEPSSRSGQLAALEDKVDTLCRSVEELRQIVCAQAMPVGTS